MRAAGFDLAVVKVVFGESVFVIKGEGLICGNDRQICDLIRKLLVVLLLKGLGQVSRLVIDLRVGEVFCGFVCAFSSVVGYFVVISI